MYIKAIYYYWFELVLRFSCENLTGGQSSFRIYNTCKYGNTSMGFFFSKIYTDTYNSWLTSSLSSFECPRINIRHRSRLCRVLSIQVCQNVISYLTLSWECVKENCKNEVFKMLSVRRLALSQWLSQWRSFSTIWRTSSQAPPWNTTAVLSAYMNVLPFQSVWRYKSLMYNMKRLGPRTLPWGKP